MQSKVNLCKSKIAIFNVGETATCFKGAWFTHDLFCTDLPLYYSTGVKLGNSLSTGGNYDVTWLKLLLDVILRRILLGVSETRIYTPLWFYGSRKLRIPTRGAHKELTVWDGACSIYVRICPVHTQKQKKKCTVEKSVSKFIVETLVKFLQSKFPELWRQSIWQFGL